jgi:hypothetical protein
MYVHGKPSPAKNGVCLVWAFSFFFRSMPNSPVLNIPAFAALETAIWQALLPGSIHMEDWLRRFKDTCRFSVIWAFGERLTRGVVKNAEFSEDTVCLLPIKLQILARGTYACRTVRKEPRVEERMKYNFFMAGPAFQKEKLQRTLGGYCQSRFYKGARNDASLRTSKKLLKKIIIPEFLSISRLERRDQVLGAYEVRGY